ncbi:hydroxymethylpyrimidine/phosphomethylpyrimidine kinase [Noviherbaspirillum sp. UKPF54]|uniref:bifunctional hydroxymethylpyrimidine kinase/phosphomethylpyrimidine kinase n=1 Tax=Noviherbaspirillum sp. UKPF54 TaxID=2601898 RepID=UPI0011B11588|nr:hydroxymethylpyrimidine/phosphomethylpyrimidine kinase [Noviherbaspirillum sp. UKPF54]QDZ30742.1 hydroxymethylpyrimidine/phosphomethylpyrimidine kinase [Noviherbaspirillum sp. UKPF54]
MRPSVLIFAGSDPSGGAGLQADIQAVSALGAHPLTAITVLTVQDNDRVFNVHPVPAELVRQQAHALMGKIDIAAVKIGIVGNRENAEAIADTVRAMKQRRPDLQVVLDPVLASGHGDPLAKDNAVQAIAPLLPVATLVTPNLPEAAALCGGELRPEVQVETLLRHCPNVLIKGGHGTGPEVVNRWFANGHQRTWTWPRLEGSYHGTGCTLASAVAALLAQGKTMVHAIEAAQSYCHQALVTSYAIADGQRIPNRRVSIEEDV